jgi:hypothetical protein
MPVAAVDAITETTTHDHGSMTTQHAHGMMGMTMQVINYSFINAVFWGKNGILMPSSIARRCTLKPVTKQQSYSSNGIRTRSEPWSAPA